MSRRHRAPGWCGALLQRCLPREHGALLRAELDEEYERFVRPGRGALAARIWYWRQAAGSVLWHLRHRPRPDSPKRGPTMASLIEDLRFGVRSFRRSPAFTAVALATLAVGIGATTLVFTVLNAVLLRPLPYPDPGELVRLWPGWTVTKDVMERVMARTESFEHLAGVLLERRVLAGRGEPEELVGAAVTTEHFDMLGLEPMLGRTFAAEESGPGSPPVVVLSHGLWQRAFGAEPDVVGTDVRLGGVPTVVVGVMGPEARPLEERVSYWRPMVLDPSDFSDYSGTAQTELLGRLAPGVTVERAAADVGAVAEAVHRESPDAFGEEWVRASAPSPLHRTLVADSRAGLWTAMGAVGFLLLIACVNVANLLLARSSRRQREMAVRAGLGAGPLRLARQMLTESLVLGLAGGLAGLALAAGLLDLLRALLPGDLPFATGVGIDGGVALFVFVASLLTSGIFGLAPALRVAGADPQARLREATPAASPGRHGGRIGQLFVGLEIALALVLVVGAGLMLRSLGQLTRIDPGFEPEGLTSLRVRLPSTAPYDEAAGKRAYFATLRERIGALPAVADVAGVTYLPMGSNTPSTIYRVGGVEYPPDRPPPSALFQLVVGDYFETMGIPLLQGRAFGPNDRPEAPVVGVINRALAREAFGDADPVGESITMFGGLEFEVVGVVDDTRQVRPSREPAPEAFFSYEQIGFWGSSLYLVVRARPGAGLDVASVREAIRQVDPEIPVTAIREMPEVVASASADSRFLARLLGAFAALALLLGAVGVYGVMSYAVSERMYEFGIRRSLGATGGHILRSAILGALRPALAGIVAGTGAALALSTVLRGLLHGVGTRDPLTFTVVPLVLLTVALVATYVPARRASRADPRTALGG